MAKQSMIQREIKRDKMYFKYKEQKEILKESIKNNNSFEESLKTQKKIQSIPRNSLKCRKRNRCWKTGRSRGFYRDFGLSRHVFREMAHECLLPGVKKSSW